MPLFPFQFQVLRDIFFSIQVFGAIFFNLGVQSHIFQLRYSQSQFQVFKAILFRYSNPHIQAFKANFFRLDVQSHYVRHSKPLSQFRCLELQFQVFRATFFSFWCLNSPFSIQVFKALILKHLELTFLGIQSLQFGVVQCILVFRVYHHFSFLSGISSFQFPFWNHFSLRIIQGKPLFFRDSYILIFSELIIPLSQLPFGGLNSSCSL